MKKPIMFYTRKCKGVAIGDTPTWQGFAYANGTASPEEVAAAVAEGTRQSVSDVMYTNTKTGEAIRTILRSGRNVSLDWVAFVIALTGSFERLDSDFDADRNSLVVRAHARPFLRDCLADIIPRNVTNGLVAAVQSVIDSTASAEGIIRTSAVYVAGYNILVGDAPDEGVWLVAKDGTIAATPAIVANNAATMNLEFAELPEDGTYTLLVKARSGASLDFAPATAKRVVTVNTAS